MNNETIELQGILDNFEHECFMLRVEASETRAKDDIVRNSYERIRNKFAVRIAALVGGREAELQSALNKAAGNWAKVDELLREPTCMMKKLERFDGDDPAYRCSECGHENYELCLPNYCPNCGRSVVEHG